MLALFSKGRRRIVHRNNVSSFAVPAVDVSELGVADTYRVRQHGLENRLQFTWRTADKRATPPPWPSVAPATQQVHACATAPPRTTAYSRWRSRPVWQRS